MANPCIFCGKEGGSHEHLWSDALGPEIARYIPKDSNRSFRGRDDPAGDAAWKINGMPLYALTIPCVCHPCNNEWMNRVDERARKKLIRLIRDQHAEYDELDCVQLSSWLAMKMIVRDQHEGTRPAFTSQAVANFYLTGLPPSDMWIGLAQCGAPIWASAFHRQDRIGASGAREASYTMGLGAAVAFVEYPVSTIEPKDVPTDQVLTVWPQPGAFDWPARPRLSAAQIRKVSMRFFPALDSAADFSTQIRYQREAAARVNRHQRRSSKNG
jgi:hypothetical protein